METTLQAGIPVSSPGGGLLRRGWMAAALALSLMAGSCRREPLPATPEIEDAQDLIAALQDSGVAVGQPTASEATGFGVAGQRVSVQGEAVHIFEYPSRAARLSVSEALSSRPVSASPSGDPAAPTSIWALGRLIVTYQGIQGGTILLLNGLLGDPIRPAPPEQDEPYPPAVPAAMSALAAELNLDPASIQVLSYEPVEWPDACLGLGGSDEECAAVITPGWKIELLALGLPYSMRSDELGLQVRRE